jgi:hypothetical protein
MKPAGESQAVRQAVAIQSSTTPSESHLIDALASELRAEVIQRWATYYPWRVATGVPDITLTPRQCGFSAIFKVDLDFPSDPQRESFVIKIRREQKHGSFLRTDLTERTLALSRTEYREHVRAYTFFCGKVAGLSVVRPLDFIESHNALVVEHARGRDLSKLVKQRDASAQASVQRCGEWWRRFHHELHQSHEHMWDPDLATAALDQRLTRLRRFNAPADLLETLRAEILRASRLVAPVPVPVSLVHGDCKLRHVWATPQGIQVLDFGNTKIGDSWSDPAALVVELSLYSLWSRRVDALLKGAEIRTLLFAYFGGPPPTAFSLYVVDCLLKKWHRRLRKWGPGPGMTRLRRSLHTAGLDKRVERLYIDRWFTGQIRAWLAMAGGTPPAWLKTVVE